MKPSDKAISFVSGYCYGTMERIAQTLKGAYAIDVDPEIERLKEEARINDLANDVAQDRIAALEAENAKLRDDIEELTRVFRHTHKAHYIDGMLTDICDTCQFDMRHQIHFRKGEP